MIKVRRPESERATLVAQWRNSGLSVLRFASQVGVPVNTLHGWIQKAATPSFARVVVTPREPRAEASFTVEVAGASIHVTKGFDSALLREVVMALRETSK